MSEWSARLAASPEGTQERIDAYVRDELKTAREIFARPRRTTIETWRD